MHPVSSVRGKPHRTESAKATEEGLVTPSRCTLNTESDMETARAAFGSQLGTYLQRIRVPAGFVFGILFVLFSRPTPALLVSGLVLASCGLAIRVWSAGHLLKHKELTVSGPYRWVRNPLYLGSFVLGCGFTAASGAWWLFALFFLLFLSIYIPVMKAEELELRASYGPPYADYCRTVPAFLPVRKPTGAATPGGFAWSRVFENREYNAALGFVLVAVILLLKLQQS